MGLGGSWDTTPLSKKQQNQADSTIETAINAGITHFDHADIYTYGKAEQAFGNYLKGILRFVKSFLFNPKQESF